MGNSVSMYNSSPVMRSAPPRYPQRVASNIEVSIDDEGVQIIKTNEGTFTQCPIECGYVRFVKDILLGREATIEDFLAELERPPEKTLTKPQPDIYSETDLDIEDDIDLSDDDARQKKDIEETGSEFEELKAKEIEEQQQTISEANHYSRNMRKRGQNFELIKRMVSDSVQQSSNQSLSSPSLNSPPIVQKTIKITNMLLYSAYRSHKRILNEAIFESKMVTDALKSMNDDKFTYAKSGTIPLKSVDGVGQTKVRFTEDKGEKWISLNDLNLFLEPESLRLRLNSFDLDESARKLLKVIKNYAETRVPVGPDVVSKLKELKL